MTLELTVYRDESGFEALRAEWNGCSAQPTRHDLPDLGMADDLVALSRHMPGTALSVGCAARTGWSASCRSIWARSTAPLLHVVGCIEVSDYLDLIMKPDRRTRSMLRSWRGWPGPRRPPGMCSNCATSPRPPWRTSACLRWPRRRAGRPGIPGRCLPGHHAASARSGRGRLGAVPQRAGQEGAPRDPAQVRRVSARRPMRGADRPRRKDWRRRWRVHRPAPAQPARQARVHDRRDAGVFPRLAAALAERAGCNFLPRHRRPSGGQLLLLRLPERNPGV